MGVSAYRGVGVSALGGGPRSVGRETRRAEDVVLLKTTIRAGFELRRGAGPVDRTEPF
jgi:hypothetical protein